MQEPGNKILSLCNSWIHCICISSESIYLLTEGQQSLSGPNYYLKPGLPQAQIKSNPSFVTYTNKGFALTSEDPFIMVIGIYMHGNSARVKEEKHLTFLSSSEIVLCLCVVNIILLIENKKSIFIRKWGHFLVWSSHLQ